MKKILSAILAISILSAMILSGCMEQLNQFAEANISSAVETSSEDILEEGEVEFYHEENPQITVVEQNVPSTSKLSQNEIEALVKNADDVLAQYPDFSGTVLMSSGNQIIYEKSFGKTGKGKDKNENDTYYQIGSVTKQFTGTAILLLEREGKIRTSDTIDKYFPEEYKKYDWIKSITVSHLLQMSAGMGDYMEIIEGDQELLDGYVKAAKKSEKDAQKFILKTIFDAGIATTPGTVYTYSNSAYYLLGLIIEQLSGMTYREYLQENFFDMAGMTDTYFVGDGKDYQTGYSYAEEKFICEKNDKYLSAEGDYPYLFSAGSVVSTVEDVNKWLDVVVSNDLFTSDERKKIEKSLMLYNYGWNTSDNLWHHSGRTYLYSSQIYADYHTDTKLVILSNIAFYDNLNQISLAMYLPLVSASKNKK